MNALRDGLVAMTKENHEGAWYCPLSKLDLLFNVKSIRKAIEESEIKPYHRKEVVQAILQGGKRVFAATILMERLLCMVKFMERDHLQHQPLDARLPFPKSELVTILGETEGALFYRNQWMVSAPIFCADLSHRSFDRAAVLPFITDKEIPGGASGSIHETTIDSEHQIDAAGASLPPNFAIIRKVIALESTDDSDAPSSDSSKLPESEGHVLSLLRLIRHPSMVRFLSSYTFRNTYNLLFEPAESDLASLLARSERPFALTSDDAFIQALQGLCSAVAAFHQFAHPELELYLKGYHHDLKPENILVHGHRFLLSDFGLSKLKGMRSKSKTLSKDIIGYYISPESETIEDGFQSKLIGQPSDIWALGCILAVVLTYIQRGAAGVQEFERRRRHKSQNWTAFTFHCIGKPNPEVQAWLYELEAEESKEFIGIIALIRDMLQIDPSERPVATIVSSRMDFLAIQSTYNSTMSKFKRLGLDSRGIVIWIEQKRVHLFGEALQLSLLQQEWHNVQQLTTADTNFETIRDYFIVLGQDLDTYAEHTDLTSYPALIVRRIRDQVDRLWNTLLPIERAKLEASLESHIVDTKDVELLEEYHKEFGEIMTYKNIGLAAAARAMIILANQNKWKNPALEWDVSHVHEIQAITPFSSLAYLTNARGQRQQKVLVEWLEYDERWQGSVGEELVSRIISIAEILHDHEVSGHLSALRCLHYFHKSPRFYGLVFELPMPYRVDLSVEQSPIATSLASLIKDTRKQRKRPNLGDAFKLAASLTAAVLKWHEIGWLHRGISAYNIVFFGTDPASLLGSISEPSFLGFQFSRPDNKDAFTLGPTTNPEILDYCHPEYLKDSVRYRPEFDYYSLGLVLLEIGYWKTLKDITGKFSSPDNSPENLREWILQTVVEDLHMIMGSTYQEAVMKCLTFQGGRDLQRDAVVPHDIQNDFRTNVLERIQQCHA